jgi:hypothetical protein
MADPIEAHYTPDGDDWTVAVTGRGRTLTGRAPGLIAARDRADQLVEQLAPEETGHRTVVHMLNGDAVEFTTAYLTARLARTEEPPLAVPAPATEAATQKPANQKPTAEAEPEGKAAKNEPPAAATPEKPEAPTPAKAAVKPTPFPRKESDAAKPAAQPPKAETLREESATSST